MTFAVCIFLKLRCVRVMSVYSRSAQGRRRVWVGHRSIRRVLHGARPTVAAELHVQVQGDRRRGPATPVAARMSQRVASRRSAPSVSEQFCHFSETIVGDLGGNGGGGPPKREVDGTEMLIPQIFCKHKPVDCLID